MEADRRSDKKADVIADILSSLMTDDIQSAERLAIRGYPFSPYQSTKRKCTEYQSMKIFLRDGFIDRYSGQRLIFPGLLRLLSVILPEAFPAHKNWKMSESHIVYWELFPTIDHVIPVVRGGEDVEDNLVTTSMLRNQAKSQWTLEELNWTLVPGESDRWDGLTSMTLQYLAEHPKYMAVPYISRWCRAANRAIE